MASTWIWEDTIQSTERTKYLVSFFYTVDWRWWGNKINYQQNKEVISSLCISVKTVEGVTVLFVRSKHRHNNRLFPENRTGPGSIVAGGSLRPTHWKQHWAYCGSFSASPMLSKCQSCPSRVHVCIIDFSIDLIDWTILANELLLYRSVCASQENDSGIFQVQG